jgi:hypothetical protein
MLRGAGAQVKREFMKVVCLESHWCMQNALCSRGASLDIGTAMIGVKSSDHLMISCCEGGCMSCPL